MNSIKQALERLNGSINTLEFNVELAVAHSSGQQGDMFSAPSKPAPSNQNSAAVAQRLDNAIDAVEKLLKGA